MVAKYSIVGLTAGQVLVSRNSVKAIKQEFQRLVTENESDLVVLDYTGETFVRYVGGKILKGTNYRKFTRRGVQEPKPKAPACVVPTIQNVCQDVIYRIDAQLTVGEHGIGLIDIDALNLYAVDKAESAQPILKETTCHVCGKGALLVSFVSLFNNFTVDDLQSCNYDLSDDEDGSTIERWPKELLNLFGVRLLDEIEMAFEQQPFSWNSVTRYSDRYNELRSTYGGIYNPTQRLRTIMCDVRDGKF